MAQALIPGLGPRDEIPRPMPGADPVAAGLTAQEGWVFSRVDGHTSFAELFHITGLGEPQTTEILKALVARGLVLTKQGAPVPAARPPKTRPPKTSPPKTPPSQQTELDGMRAEVQAAQAAAQAATQAREKTLAEDEAAQAALLQHKDAMGRAETDWKQIESSREAARMAEEQARASVLALREALVRAEMEVTRLAAEREKILRDTEVQSHRAAESRGKAGQAVAFADLAAKARALAVAEEQRALAHLAQAQASLSTTEQRATDATQRARKEAEHAAARDLENLVKGYAAEEPERARPREANAPQPILEATDTTPKFDLPSDSDLPDDVRKRIMRKHVKLATQDLFQLLELPLDCDKRDVKRAYFKLSKEFHPDRFFGKKLGAYKEMLAEVFRSVSQAAEFLRDDARRAEYQTMIQGQREMRELEESFAKATEAVLLEAQEVAVTEEAEAAVSNLAAKAAQVRPDRSAPASPAQPVRSATGSRLVQKMLAKNLKSDRVDKAQKHFEEGERQVKAQRWVSAMHNFKLAAALMPGNAEYESMVVRAQAHAAEEQATVHAKRADFEERAGRYKTAARCWEQAIALFATSAFCVKAVEMFLQIRELNKALEYGIKGVELDSANASAHLALGEVYRERKQLIDAKKAVERAISLDPKNQEARELLKEVGRSA